MCSDTRLKSKGQEISYRMEKYRRLSMTGSVYGMEKSKIVAMNIKQQHQQHQQAEEEYYLFCGTIAGEL
ncbi:hypothetical protein T10_5687 [Trichinella papuae]|uniref:Uncharacterized protein n=1 Tax=Trichinella papuae TaxID=268474 RepID=A0A0V1N185_9BILA|nr:hypothetical protein T10_5687 [Trichinella papuae]